MERRVVLAAVTDGKEQLKLFITKETAQKGDLNGMESFKIHKALGGMLIKATTRKCLLNQQKTES